MDGADRRTGRVPLVGVNRMKLPLPEVELVCSGHTACPGCSLPLALRYVLKALGPKTIVVIPPSCAGPLAGNYPVSALKVPILRVAFETTAISATGVRAALDAKGRQDVHVLAWGGDGATYDIGLQALSSAAERNDDIFYVCYDNEGYMNTGMQRSSATPKGAWTTTTPYAKKTRKKNLMQIMAAHRIPFAATASIGYPTDFLRKVEKAKEIQGMKFFLVHSPCPTGWRYSPEWTIRLAKLAVQSGLFPLYEILDGETYRINRKPSKTSIRDYLSPQGRFRSMKEEDIQAWEEQIKREWRFLNHMAAGRPEFVAKTDRP